MAGTVLVGGRYGRMVVLDYSLVHHRWHCRCDCGTESHRTYHSLITTAEPMCSACYRDVARRRGWGDYRIVPAIEVVTDRV